MSISLLSLFVGYDAPTYNWSKFEITIYSGTTFKAHQSQVVSSFNSTTISAFWQALSICLIVSLSFIFTLKFAGMVKSSRWRVLFFLVH